jgi:hypothetical protein
MDLAVWICVFSCAMFLQVFEIGCAIIQVIMNINLLCTAEVCGNGDDVKACQDVPSADGSKN